MSEQELYEQAKKIVKQKRDFYSHLIVYVLVNSILVVAWAASGAGFPWFIFPLGGWGIGIVFHFLETFVFNGRTGWERRQIEKEAERLRKEQN